MIDRFTPVRRAISAFGFTLLASLALAAAAAGAASATTLHWHQCLSGGGAREYTNSLCTEKKTISGTGLYGLESIRGGSSTGSAMNGTGAFAINWEVSGVKVQLTCTTEIGENGTVENPVAGGAGIAKLNFRLEHCSTTHGVTGCSTQPIRFETTGIATEFGGAPAVKFNPLENSIRFSLEGGRCGLRQLVVIYGEFTGVRGSSSSLEFTEASSNLIYGGRPASIVGASNLVETATGNALALAP